MSATYCSVSQFKERHSKGRATYSLSLPSFRPLPFFLAHLECFTSLHIASIAHHNHLAGTVQRPCRRSDWDWSTSPEGLMTSQMNMIVYRVISCYSVRIVDVFFTKGTLLLILTVVPFAITSSRSSNSGFSNMFKTFEVCLSFGTMVLNRFHFKFTPNYSEFLCWRNFWSWSG